MKNASDSEMTSKISSLLILAQIQDKKWMNDRRAYEYRSKALEMINSIFDSKDQIHLYTIGEIYFALG
jgi:hypothetical protein